MLVPGWGPSCCVVPLILTILATSLTPRNSSAWHHLCGCVLQTLITAWILPPPMFQLSFHSRSKILNDKPNSPVFHVTNGMQVKFPTNI